MASSSAKVTLGPELERSVEQLVRSVAGDVVAVVEQIASDLAEGARQDWYKNVRRKSGRSGAGNVYRMEVTATSIRGVVHNTATKNQSRKLKFTGAPGNTIMSYGPTEYGYYVRRAGPFSRLYKGLNAFEYSQLMSYWQRTGRLPDGYIAQSMTDALGRARPIGVSKEINNPLALDGKNVWKVLVIDRKNAAIAARLDDLDTAMQRSADRFST